MTQSVYLHAYTVTAEGDQEYTDGGDTPINGWCVYRQIDPAVEGEPYETPDEDDRDFPTFEAAMAFAQDLAAQHGGLEIREY